MHGRSSQISQWQQRLKQAVDLRKNVLQFDNVAGACRVIHAESDGLSGIVVDKRGNVLSAECYSLGMYRHAVVLLEQLAPLVGTCHLIIKTSPQF